MRIADLYGIAILFFLSGICDGEDTESESCNTHDCAGTSTTTGAAVCRTTPVNEKRGKTNTLCIFPFTHKGVTYTKCPFHTQLREFWCSTKVDRSGNHLSGQREWGFCGPNCPRIKQSDNIYVVGGYKSGEFLNTVEVFQPGPNTWSELPPMSTPRWSPAVAVINNQLYAVGGYNSQQGRLNTAEKFNPQTGQWTDIANMTTGRSLAGAAELQGQLFVVGGFTGRSALSSVEKLVGNEWQVAASLPQPRAVPGLVELGRKLYAIGGWDDQTILKSVSVFDGVRWAEMQQMQEARNAPGVATMGGRIFAAGGEGEAGTILRSVEMYDPTTKEWSYVANMNVGRYRPALVSAGGKLYVFGGGGDGWSELTSVEMFNPETNSWKIIGDMKVCAGYVGAGVLRH